MLQKKSVLARLLANENISVQQGNFPTASFDVVNRVLNLPNWKEMSNDLYDMLVGHEVSHALNTPSDPEVLNIPNVPFSFINIVEDIRIEKLIMRKYPGLVGNFTRGYKELIEMDIFGTKNKPLNILPFMDRLNIKSKGRSAVEVEFSDEEKYYFDKAMAVETFEDVREVVLEIAEWLRSKNEIQEEPESNEFSNDDNAEDQEQNDNQDSNKPEGDDDSSEEVEQGSGQETEEAGEDDSQEENRNGSSASGDEDEAKESEESEEDNKEEEGNKGAGGEDIHTLIKKNSDFVDDLEEAMTDIAQHENEGKLLDDSSKVYAQALSREEYEAYTIPYKRVLEVRQEAIDVVADRFGKYRIENAEQEWKEFEASAKPIVNLMAKEFEMRKAAYRTKRAKTSTKGSLDVTKLHAYKYDDNLFKQVTTLADGKSHGLMMLVDYSGSMHDVMPAVIRQTITLVMFCKRVGIPFQVFGFTSPHGGEPREVNYKPNLTTFDSTELQMIELYSSKMTKAELEFAYRSQFYSAYDPYYFQSRLERLGNTPLNSAVMAMQYAIKDFRKANPVEKMRLVTLTDGESNSVRILEGNDIRGTEKYWNWNTPVITEVNGKKIELQRGYSASLENTAKILRAVAGNDVSLINFFIACTSELRKELYRLFPWQEDNQKAARKQIKDTGAFVIDGDIGYDRRFIIPNKGNALSGKTDDLEVAEDMTPAQIARAFKKFSGSKKNNRIIAKKFAEMVA